MSLDGIDPEALREALFTHAFGIEGACTRVLDALLAAGAVVPAARYEAAVALLSEARQQLHPDCILAAEIDQLLAGGGGD